MGGGHDVKDKCCINNNMNAILIWFGCPLTIVIIRGAFYK
jgi:hypothetical protein